MDPETHVDIPTIVGDRYRVHCMLFHIQWESEGDHIELSITDLVVLESVVLLNQIEDYVASADNGIKFVRDHNGFDKAVSAIQAINTYMNKHKYAERTEFFERYGIPNTVYAATNMASPIPWSDVLATKIFTCCCKLKNSKSLELDVAPNYKQSGGLHLINEL